MTEQMQLEGLLKEGISLDDPKVTEISFAATALAKQMMETTKDAAQNAKAVLSYNLPTSFDQLSDPEAKKMIEKGNFYTLASKIVQLIEAGDFPLPDPERLLSPFQDSSGKGIRVDSEEGGGAYDFTEAYKAKMKGIAKENGVKGKNLFHPVRLALTGEMSGQDVTKQLSLVALASKADSAIDGDAVGIVDIAGRMERLKAFLETIPEEFRTVEAKDVGSKGKQNDTEEARKEGQAAPQPNTAVLDPKDTYEGPPISALDIRVGRIGKVWMHEEADKLYCEEIDVGEDEPRQIASGLRPFMEMDELEGRLCLVLCNLKTRKLVGFPSHGMVLCASNADHTEVRLVAPPQDAKIGERITIPDFDFESEAPFAENKVGKKKVVEKLAAFLVTNKYGVPEFLGRPFMTSSGVCSSPIADGTVS